MGKMGDRFSELLPAAKTGDERARLELLMFGHSVTGCRDSDNLRQAAAYRLLGMSVVPQLPGAKQPRIPWKPFQTRLPTVDEIEDWWGYRWPGAGIAVVLGSVSGLLGVDVDGEEAHNALAKHLGGVPKAPRSISGSGKPFRYHLFFKHPDVETNAKFCPWHPNLEFRGHGGIVILPPSKHKSGNCYEWAPGRSIGVLKPPAVPMAILTALQDRANGLARRKVHVAPAMGTTTICSALKLGNYAFGLAHSTKLYLQGEFANGPDWNGKLFRAACDLAANGMTEAVATPLLIAGAQPWNDAEAAVAMATIASAYSQPRYRARRAISHKRWIGRAKKG